ncbi:MAG TPA: MBL fold metallo-hydrolase [Ramlibacter sp.]|uniref:MBL fold metallo-hydrolase n=1 Tax=Ramlibacter sp. TaxID=1917967 RepID=UPI002D7FA538|nr:MBL fold metallo-hydrolase [Ramlibacter sp.]HET8746959.1 MBL fold metallo-hydrolase [Ramlibacter sp.]
MRIHHLNCISSCPLGGRLMDGRTQGILTRGRLCCHCLAIESDDGIVLVDTGFGLNDVRTPRKRLSGFFLALLSPDFREELTALRQLQALGFSAADVRHIVLTHLDFDHAGGLDDFPHAAVHMLQQERDYALLQKTWLDRQRFRPQQWSTRARWRVYPASAGEPWFGFDAVRQLAGLPPEILLVPLAGHTHGHAGVAIRTDGHWLLQTGDAYFWHQEMDFEHPRCTPGLRMYQTLMEKDRARRLANQQRLRALRREHGQQIEIFCAHDPIEYERLTGHPMGEPLGAHVHAHA